MSPLILASLTLIMAPESTRAAHPKQCDPDDSKSCVAPISQGQVAPFSGQLLTPRRAIKLAVQAGQCQERVDLAREEEKAVAQQDVQTLEAILKHRQQTHEIELDLVKRRMEEWVEEVRPEWYERPLFVAVVTAAVTTGLFAGAVKTIEVLGR